MSPRLEPVGQCWFTLDREWVIASCGDGAPGSVSQSVGMNVWDAFPGSEDAFRPAYEKAWANGNASAVVYWNEAFTSLTAFARDDHLLVSVQFIPVNGLEDAIGEALAAQTAPKQIPRRVQERRLRLVLPA